MRILGLTGSIGMGKSTAAGIFRRMGVPVHDADATVHRLMEPSGLCFPAIVDAFPTALKDGRIDRRALGQEVFSHPERRQTLEAILHPAVRAATRACLATWSRRRVPIVVLDIPLLFETGAERRCDAVCVVTAPASLQRRRVLARPGMTETTLTGVLNAQVPDGEKRRRADYIIHSGLGLTLTQATIREILSHERVRPATTWPRGFPFQGHKKDRSDA